MALFERFFLTFSLSTWTDKVAHAIPKERKTYLFDAARIHDPGTRFENLVAIELARAVTAWTAWGHGEFSLHFVRNKAQQEVDFLIARDRRPVLLIEAKLGDAAPAKALQAIQAQLQIPAVQLVQNLETFRWHNHGTQPILVAPAAAWLADLPV